MFSFSVKCESASTNRLIAVLAALTFTLSTATASPRPEGEVSSAPVITLLASSPAGLSLGFESQTPRGLTSASSPELLTALASAESRAYIGGNLSLPAVSRLVAIPPNGGVMLSVSNLQTTVLQGFDPGLLPSDLSSDTYETGESYTFSDSRPLPTSGLWPPEAVVVGKPAIMRGQRLVSVTCYPYQYDADAKALRVNESLEASLAFGGVGENEVVNPNRPRPSRDFERLLRDVVINPTDSPSRDDGEVGGSILYILCNDNGVEDGIAPLLEWRRRMGWKVEAVTIRNGVVATDIQQGIIQEAYDEWEYPPETIVLVGDATQGSFWLPTFDTREGAQYIYESDHPYTLLEGDDILPEVSIGRLSFQSIASLNAIVNKIIQYESEPFLGAGQAAGWQRRAAFAAIDASSGQSSIDVCLWSGNLLRNFGYNPINNLFFSGDNPNPDPTNFIRDNISAGMNIFALRGSATMNDWMAINALNFRNGPMLPFIILGTCNTGDFMQDNWQNVAWTENFLRAPQGGAIGAVGASGATSCQYNNVMISSTLRHIFALGVKSQGWALMGGKLDLYKNYFGRGDRMHPDNRNTENWLVTTNIYNLMGDPVTRLFTDIPTPIFVQHQETIREGQTEYEVLVRTDEEGNEPLAGANVCLYVPDVFQQTGVTDDEGVARFVIDALDQRDDGMMVTVFGDNLVPYLAELDISQVEDHIGVFSFTVNDGGDERASPSEEFELSVLVQNFGDFVPEGAVDLVLESEDERITIVSGQDRFDESPREGQSEDATFRVRLGGEFHHADMAAFRLVITAGERQWQSSFEIPVFGASPSVDNLVWERDALRPGEQATCLIRLRNDGDFPTAPLQGQLFSLDPLITIVDDITSIDEIEPGETELSGEPFELAAAILKPGGASVSLGLRLTSEAGWIDTLYFTTNLATADADQPFGPDNYGYVCIDNTDENWFNAPIYDWIEINPESDSVDAEGERLDLDDVNEEQDASIVVDLPFSFQMYGVEYEQITVCTNGWIAMGDQHLVTTGRNQTIPSGMVSSGMLCPFWDDLVTAGGQASGVYVWFDDENARFIIEWFQMRKLAPQLGPVETFQVILHDPEIWPSITGDGDIIFQYREIEDARECYESWDTPFATVGIGSVDQTDGLLYTYYGRLTPGAAPLEEGRAIKFTTFVGFDVGRAVGTVRDAATNQPVARALVTNNFGYGVRTDEQGNYVMESVISGRILTFTASAQGYNDSTRGEFQIEPDQELRIDFNLLHPEFLISEERFEATIDSGNTADFPFTLTNRGNGPLTWNARATLRGNADREPWELRESFNVGQTLDDERIEGVVFGNDQFFLSGANVSADPDDNLIYVLDREGELVDTFLQTGSTRWGYKDMDWDGEHIWAAGDMTIYSLSTSGEVITSWADPLTPTEKIACDTEHGLLYLSGTTTNIIRCDYAGNQVGAPLERKGLRLYGLAWWPDDPDGFNLYIVNSPGAGQFKVTKMDVETGDTMAVHAFVPQGTGQFQSAYIAKNYDAASWVIMTIQRLSRDLGDDRLEIYQILGRTDWMRLSDVGGDLQSGGSQDVTLTLDTRTFDDAVYEGEIEFTHNAAGGVSAYPVTLTISDEVGAASEPSPAPHAFHLSPPYPNPFNSATTISFSLPGSGEAGLRVYDLQGRLVKELVNGRLEAGEHKVVWEAKGLGSGVYVVKLEGAGKSLSRKIVLMR